MNLNVDQFFRFTVKYIVLIGSFCFFSTNSFAITCVDDDDCPAEIRKLAKFAKGGSPRAQIMLATLYSKGNIVEKDLNKSFKWIRKAYRFKPTIPIANHILAVAYFNGEGTDKDVEKGLSLLNKSADAGYAKSQSLLGVIYFQGRETKIDMIKARTWFQRAAENNDSTAAFFLGKMFENGLGGEVDLQTAVEWYDVAAKLGHQEAADKIKALAENNSDKLDFSSLQSSIKEISEKGEEIIIVRDEMSLLELISLYTSQINKDYLSRGSTGSRIRGVVCGRGTENCARTTGTENISNQMRDFRNAQRWSGSVSMNNSDTN